MFKDKMCKTTVAPSDGLGTTLNNVVYFVIYVIVYRVRPVKFRSNIKFITSVQLGVEIRHAGMLRLFFVFLTKQTGLFSSMYTRHTP